MMPHSRDCLLENQEKGKALLLVVKATSLDFITSPSFRSQVESMLDHGQRSFIIDLSEVSFIDSSALQVLVDAHRRCKAGGGAVLLVHQGKDENDEDNSVLRAFSAAGLDRVFMIFPTAEGAANYADEYQIA